MKLIGLARLIVCDDQDHLIQHKAKPEDGDPPQLKMYNSKLNERKALEYIEDKLKSALDLYPTSLEEDDQILNDKVDKLSVNERNCIMYSKREK